MMKTREIPREKWARYLDELSRRHQGGRIRLEVLDPDSGPGVEVEQLPLEGLVADLRHGRQTVEIYLRGQEGEHLAHMVQGPVSLRVLEGGDGGPEVLEVRSEGGVATLLHLHPAGQPGRGPAPAAG